MIARIPPGPGEKRVTAERDGIPPAPRNDRLRLVRSLIGLRERGFGRSGPEPIPTPRAPRGAGST